MPTGKVQPHRETREAGPRDNYVIVGVYEHERIGIGCERMTEMRARFYDLGPWGGET